MQRKLMLTAMLFAVCQLSFALTCPSVAELKHGALTGWRAFDSDDGSTLTAKREAQFKKSAEEFALAEWTQATKNNPGGTIHCYYRDHTGSDLEAYLAKENFVLKNAKHYWYEVSGFMHCAAGNEKCEFESQLLRNSPQLAKR